MPIRQRTRRRAAFPRQKVIGVKVDYFSEEEKENLTAYPTFKDLEKLVSNTVEIPMEEFLTYYLFYRRRHNPDAYASADAVRSQVHQALASMEDLTEISHGSIRIPNSVTVAANEVTEHIGESIGLSIASRAHQLTDADWKPIPQQHGPRAAPSFDFSLASDEKGFVELEAKGTVVEDNRTITPSVRGHASNIRSKKAKLAALPPPHAPGIAHRLRYGTIAAVDRRGTGRVRCWIMDPPPEQIESNPRFFRLIRRLHHLRKWISLVAPRSALAAALATRLAAIERMGNPFELDQLPLLRGNGEPFSFGQTGTHSSFFGSRSRVIGTAAGGVVGRLSDQALLFLGIRETLIGLAINQNFSEIMAYKEPPTSMDTAVQCVVPVGRFASLPLPAAARAAATRQRGYYLFTLSGRLYASSSGVLFGQLDTAMEKRGA